MNAFAYAALETKSEAAEDIDPVTEVKTALAGLTEDVNTKTAPVADLAKRLTGLEAKMNRPGAAANDNEEKSVGTQLIESDNFKSFAAAREQGRASVSVKSITYATATVGAGVSATNSLVVSDRQAGIITAPQRQMTIRDLLAPGTTEAGSIEYVVETGFTNNTAPVAEGAQKPYSDLAFNMKTAPVRTIATLFKASKQILEDAAGLASYIDVRARYGLQVVEENQLLAGSGTGQNISGLIPNATAYSSALRKTGDTRIDTIRRAALQVRRAEYKASGVVMHPDDWAEIELTKDAGSNYIVGNPQSAIQPTLWAMPVVTTTAMPAGSFLVGAFNIAAQDFDRWQARVEVSSENSTDFELNLVTIRAEERLALAIYRPESFVYGAFAA